MQRRAFVALGLTALVTPSLARADLVAPEPPRIRITGRPSNHYSSGGPPSSATWQVRNDASSPLTVRVERAVCVLQGMRLPLRVASARIDGRDAREARLAPGQEATIVVQLRGFTEQSSRAPEWTIELSLSVDGFRVVGTTVIRRLLTPG